MPLRRLAAELVPDPFARELPFVLRKAQDQVQVQSTNRGGGVEVLCYAAREIWHRSKMPIKFVKSPNDLGQSVDTIADHCVDLFRLDVAYQQLAIAGRSRVPPEKPG